MKKDFFISSLLGGIFIGLLSGLPYVRYGNCFCCMWKIGGGILAGVIFFEKTKKITLGDGFLLGLISGGIGFFIAGTIFLLEYIFKGASILGRLVLNMQNIELSQRFLDYLSRAPFMFLLFKFFSELFTDVVFGSLGGAIIGSILSNYTESRK